jgi:hypothetical protein
MYWYTLLRSYWPFPDMQVNYTKILLWWKTLMRRTNLTHLNWITNLPVWRIHTMITSGRDFVEFLHDALAPKPNQSDSDELSKVIFTTWFTNRYQGYVPALVWLLDLSLLLRHLHHTSMAKTQFWLLLWREEMPGLLYYHEYGPDAGACDLLGPRWAEWS